MRLESRSQLPEANGKLKSRNGHQEASIHEKTSYEAVNNKSLRVSSLVHAVSR